MKREEIKKVIKACENMSSLLLDLMIKVLNWAIEKEIFTTLEIELDDYRDIIEDIEAMPEELYSALLNQLVVGQIFANPSNLQEYLNQCGDFLSREEKKIIRHFLENPWFYSLFSVEEVIGPNFFRVFDYSKNRSFLLVDSTVQRLLGKGANLFLCFLFDNGACHQSRGAKTYFQGFTVNDIKFFANYASPFYKKDGDLSRAIYHNPVPYLLLYKYSQLPAQTFEGKPIEYCYHTINVTQFEPAKYSNLFDFQEKEEVVMCTSKEGNEDGNLKKVFFDKKNGSLHVHTMGINIYHSIVKLFEGKYDFPLDPFWRASPLMGMALADILGIKSPGIDIENIFKKAPNISLHDKLNLLNSLGLEIAESIKNKKEYSVEKLAKKYDLPVETVLQLARRLLESA